MEVRRQVGTLTYLSKVIAGLAPLPVSDLAPQFARQDQAKRRSKRLREQDGEKLEYDSRRPKYAKRSGLNYATTLFNEKPAGLRNSLRQEIRDRTIKRCKHLVVDNLRETFGTRKRPKRKRFAHDPHSERGPSFVL